MEAIPNRTLEALETTEEGLEITILPLAVGNMALKDSSTESANSLVALHTILSSEVDREISQDRSLIHQLPTI